MLKKGLNLNGKIFNLNAKLINDLDQYDIEMVYNVKCDIYNKIIIFNNNYKFKFYINNLILPLSIDTFNKLESVNLSSELSINRTEIKYFDFFFYRNYYKSNLLVTLKLEDVINHNINLLTENDYIDITNFFYNEFIVNDHFALLDNNYENINHLVMLDNLCEYQKSLKNYKVLLFKHHIEIINFDNTKRTFKLN